MRIKKIRLATLLLELHEEDIMVKITFTAVFDSRRKAEEAVTQLSQIGLTDVFIKTSRHLPDFSLTGAGSLSFFSVIFMNLISRPLQGLYLRHVLKRPPALSKNMAV